MGNNEFEKAIFYIQTMKNFSEIMILGVNKTIDRFNQQTDFFKIILILTLTQQ